MDFEDHLLDCFSQLSVGGLFPQAVIQTSFPMPLHETLKRLHALDKTSSLFHWHLNSFLRSDEYQLLSPSGLQKEDLASLVQYLDSVLVSISDHGAPIFQACLHELRKICGMTKIMPSSCMVSNSLLVVGRPSASGRVHEGTFGGSKVQVRRIQSYPGKYSQKLEEVFREVVVVWKHLTHRNIVPLLGTTINPLQLVLVGVPDEDLTEHVANHQDANTLSLLSDVAGGLCYLHSCNVVHGNLNAKSILVDPNGCARITDIGLFAVAQYQVSLQNVPGNYQHRVYWAAPEILETPGAYSKEADVFAFAGVVIETFTGAAPFGKTSNPNEAVLAIANGKRPPRPDNPLLTEELWILTQRCWNKGANQRPRASEIMYSFNIPAWKRLINRPLPADELVSQVTALLSDRRETEAAKNLRGEDAQTFVDVIDKIYTRVPPLQKEGCLNILRKICSRQALFPSSLKISIHYDRLSAPPCHGGYSDVWKGKFQDIHVAVKVVKVYTESDILQLTRRFCKEVVTWKFLQHPNVLSLLGVTTDGSELTMVSEWMDNGKINEFVKTKPSFNRFELLKDVVRGLLYLHDWGMIHGDLKGANILIDKNCHARLADFGFLATVSVFTTSSSAMSGGTPRWMSPELLYPEEFGFESDKVTKESDCYALGMVILEVLSDQIPFAHDKNVVVIRKVLEGERPERPNKAWFTDDLWETLNKCWSPLPMNRPAVRDVLPFLERLSRTWKPLDPNVYEGNANESRSTLDYYPTGTGSNNISVVSPSPPPSVLDQVVAQDDQAPPRHVKNWSKSFSQGASLFPTTVPTARGFLDPRRRRTIPQPSPNRTRPLSSSSEPIGPVGFHKLSSVSSFHSDPGARTPSDASRGYSRLFSRSRRPLGQLPTLSESTVVKQELSGIHDVARGLQAPRMGYSPTPGTSNPGPSGATNQYHRRRHTTLTQSFSPTTHDPAQPRPTSWHVRSTGGFPAPPVHPTRRSTLSTQIPVPRNSREIRGVTLPQGPYIPKNMQDSFVRDEPIMFVDGYGRDGVSLADALDEDFNNLIGDGLMLANYAEAVIALRLEWPGYKSWTVNIRIKDRTDGPKPITTAQLATAVARGVRMFITEHAKEPVTAGAERWKVGPGFLEVEKLVLVCLVQVSKRSWQPELRVVE